MRIIRTVAVFILFAFLAPMAAATGWWSMVDRPSSWRSADWSSTGLLPPAAEQSEAVVYILSARTGGFKGAFAVHSWIVLKEAGANRYERYEKVGWGAPIRRDAYAADAAWYSNRPWVVASLTGAPAEKAIPMIHRSIDAYPYAHSGDYRIWPGPNSNSFVAHVMRETPAIDAVLPPNAVGRDFPSSGRWVSIDPDGRDMHLTVSGLAGLSVGMRSGIEIHLLGQTAGLDLRQPALKIPAVGRVGF